MMKEIESSRGEDKGVSEMRSCRTAKKRTAMIGERKEESISTENQCSNANEYIRSVSDFPDEETRSPTIPGRCFIRKAFQ